MSYDTALVTRARELRHAGWSVDSICTILQRETGRKPAYSTVYCWLNPSFTERRRSADRANKRRRIAAQTTGSMRSNHRSAEFRIARIHALGATDLSPNAIAKVMNLDFTDIELSEHQIRGVLAHGRMPRNLARAAA